MSQPQGELVVAVVQDALDGRVLMVAYMDDEARRLTLSTGEVHFWSRSRKRIWKKGETSGNVLRLVELKADCDDDALLVRAHPAGPTCHTGARTCFGVDGKEPPPTELAALSDTIEARRSSSVGKSYTRQLLSAGRSLTTAKIAEEAAELNEELVRPFRDRARIVSESADLLFHMMVGLAEAGCTLADVEAELQRRNGRSGLAEKASRKP
jgi:phosphoribosyl-ATP pyrophosphohydrolase/phosphoribosyl-AMP cyclohydrolase